MRLPCTSNSVVRIFVTRTSSICGFSDVVSVTNQAFQTPATPILTAIPAQICLNQATTITGSGSSSIFGGGYSFSILGTGTLFSLAVNKARLTSNVANVVTINGRYSSVCSSDLAIPLLVTIGGSLPPPATISILGSIFCTGRNNTVLVSPFTPNYVYTWSVNNALTLVNSNQNSATIAGLSNNLARIFVTRTSSICGFSDVVSITTLSIQTPATPILTATPAQICSNQASTITGSGSSSSFGGAYSFSILGIGTLSSLAFNKTRLTSAVANVVTINGRFNSACSSDLAIPLVCLVLK